MIIIHEVKKIERGKTVQNKGFDNFKRYAAGIFALMLLVVMLFSSFYIAVEAHHDCVGEKCEVCLAIRQCEKLLHEISDGLIVLLAIILPLTVLSDHIIFKAPVLSKSTPVSVKVRLND